MVCEGDDAEVARGRAGRRSSTVGSARGSIPDGAAGRRRRVARHRHRRRARPRPAASTSTSGASPPSSVEAEIERFETALARHRRPARAHPDPAGRARGGRAPVPHPRGAPAHAVGRPPGRAGDAASSARRRRRAEWAVRKSLDQIQAVFEKHRGPVLPRPRSDVALVGERLLRTLVGHARDGLGRGRAQGQHRHRARAVARRRRAAGARRGGRLLHRGRRPHLAHGDRRARPGAPLRRRRREARAQGLVGDDRDHRRLPRRGDPRSRRRGAAALRGARRRAPRARAPAGGDPRRRPPQTSDGDGRPPARQRRDARGDPDRRRSRRRVGGPVPHRVPLPRAARAAVRGRAVRARRRGAQERAAAGRSPSARSISAATSCRRRCASPSAPTRRWGCARSATRSTASTSSARSCARSHRAAAVGPMQILLPLISGVAELRADEASSAPRCATSCGAKGSPTSPRCRSAS